MLAAVSILHLKTASLQVMVRLYEKTRIEQGDNDTAITKIIWFLKQFLFFYIFSVHL